MRLELQHPQPQEIVFPCDQPWEGNTCIYFRIIPDGGKFRMWYQGAHWQLDPQDPKTTHPYHICYPAHGLIETPSKLPGAPKEFSLFIAENYWRNEEAIRRFTLRIDGFVAARHRCPAGSCSRNRWSSPAGS